MLKDIIIAVVLFFIILFIAGWVALERVAAVPAVKSWVEKEISGALLRPVTIEKIGWERWPSQVLTGKNVRLWEDDTRQRTIVYSPQAKVDLSLFSLYRLAVGLSEIRLVKPRIVFRQDENGEWDLARMVKDLEAESNAPGTAVIKVLFKRFSIDDGSLELLKPRDLPGPVPKLKIQGHGRLKLDGRFVFQLGCRLAGSPGTVKMPLGIDETASMDITGEYAPSSTSTFAGVLRSSSTYIALKCALSPSPRFAAAVDIAKLRYRTTILENIRTILRKESGTYKVDLSDFHILGGTVDAHAAYIPSLSTDTLKVAWKAAGIKAQDLFNLLGSSVEVNGTMDYEGFLETVVGESFLKNMNGEIKVKLQKGWIANSSGLVKVLSKMNLSSLISGQGGSGGDRLPFDETHGKLKIARGIVSTEEPFVLENKTLQLAFMGSYDLARQVIDGKLAAHFLFVTDEIINKIPIVNDILLGNKKSLIPLWVSVKGNISDPEVNLLSAKTIASPAKNIIRNIFNLPQKLIKDAAGK